MYSYIKSTAIKKFQKGELNNEIYFCLVHLVRAEKRTDRAGHTANIIKVDAGNKTSEVLGLDMCS